MFYSSQSLRSRSQYDDDKSIRNRRLRKRKHLIISVLICFLAFYNFSTDLDEDNLNFGRFLKLTLDDEDPTSSSPLEQYPYLPWDERIRKNSRRKLRWLKPFSRNDRKMKRDENKKDDENNDNDQEEEEEEEDEIKFTNQPLKFLTLGGSVTWGGAIDKRHDAFPYLMKQLHPDNIVDNRAIRATGAHFPAACIQSLVEGDAFPEWELKPGDVDQHQPLDYDVILLEFSVNGFPQTEFLLQRLRKRYPRAILIYVHLHSLTNPPPATMEEDGFFDDVMKPVNGHYWKIKVPEPTQKDNQEDEYPDGFLSLYHKDKHHLSEVGHKHVADQVVNLLDTIGQQQQKSTKNEGKNDHEGDDSSVETTTTGDWGLGDQCYMWLGTWGHFPTSLSANGGDFKIFDVFKKKYAYEVEYGKKATFSFERTIGGLGEQIPLHLITMSKGDPPKYPKALVTLHPDNEDHKSIFTIDPREDELFKEWSWAHMTSPSQVGMSKHGWNVLTVEPIEETEFPARVVGIMVCGECEATPQTKKIPQQMRTRLPDSKH
jgi:hypothetical protein